MKLRYNGNASTYPPNNLDFENMFRLECDLHGVVIFVVARAGSCGVPSPTHVNKSHNRGKVPTFEP